MLQLTKRLRKYAIARWKLAADVSDKEIRTLIGRKMLAGKISADDIRKINAGEKRAKVPVPAGVGTGSKGKDGDRRPDGDRRRSKPPEGKKGNKGDRENPGVDSDDDDSDDDAEGTRKAINRAVQKELSRLGVTGTGDVNPALSFSKAARIRVKEAADNYSRSTKAAVYPMLRGRGGNMSGAMHPLAGQPVRFCGVTLDHPSDLAKAVSLAWVRYMANRSKGTAELPRWLRMTEHDKQLVLYAVHNEKWVGQMEDRSLNTSIIERSRLNELQQKTLLDDTNSGGIEISPVVFDDALILTPVLYGELFPFVNVQTLTRGRRVKGGSIVNPTFTWGVGEGTAITPFNTANFVSAFDTPIYPCTAAIELGMDFEDDTPVDLGGQVVEQFGLKALEQLDRVIAVGNGFSEPLGLFNTTTATLLNSTFGAGGPLTVSDFEGLMLSGLAKQFRNEAGAFLAYVSNDYSYRKGRSIPVGPGDERRVFGMDHAAYKLLDTEYKIQNDIPDGYIGYANLRRYRMYRRLGMQVRIETGGRQLALSNTRLIVVRMRYGGQAELGGAVALMKDAQVM